MEQGQVTTCPGKESGKQSVVPYVFFAGALILLPQPLLGAASQAVVSSEQPSLFLISLMALCSASYFLAPVYVRDRQSMSRGYLRVFLCACLAAGAAYLSSVAALLFSAVEPLTLVVTSAALGLLPLASLLRMQRSDPGVRHLTSAGANGAQQTTHDRLEAVMAAAPVGILLVDARGVIQDANAMAVELFGYAEELVGMQVDALIPQRWRGEHHQHRVGYMGNPETRSMGKGRDLSALTQRGDELPVEIALTPLPSEGLVMATIVDITERKHMEREIEIHALKLEESNKELDSFAYVASHDLKSPLRGIQNLCEFIDEDLSDTGNLEVRDHLDTLRGRVQRMERLLDDLLEYSRVGRGEHKLTEVDTNLVIHEIVQILDVPDGFLVDVNGTLPTLVTIRHPLEQVLRNLIHNAIKHHDGHGGRIEVNAYAEKAFVVFSVTDDGPGIAEAFRERVFRIFTTLSPRDEMEGSGIGLALVKKIVERYQGSVTIDDNPEGRGARISFSWPIRLADGMP